jgi:glycosyltransferase involved in cell wall biosynthesis
MVEGLVSVVIPKASPRDDEVKLAQHSLSKQTYDQVEFRIVPDREDRGANWARNQGKDFARGEFILFSDCDCEWVPDAIEKLVKALSRDPVASYAYCGFRWGDQLRGVGPFVAAEVRGTSRFSTMSLFRSKNFPWFDEKLRRLQDWDLYLTLLERDGRLGVAVPLCLFSTPVREGMSHGSEKDLSWEDADRIVRKKHGLPVPQYAPEKSVGLKK